MSANSLSVDGWKHPIAPTMLYMHMLARVDGMTAQNGAQNTAKKFAESLTTVLLIRCRSALQLGPS